MTLEGRRPLVTEVQSLVAPSAVPNPRRTTSGVDSSRLAMVLAVLQRRLGARLADQDVYVSTIGGARVAEPGADLALALAALSSRENVPLPRGLVAIGEIGLAGEIRTVSASGGGWPRPPGSGSRARSCRRAPWTARRRRQA